MPPAITHNDKEKLVAVLAELSDNAVPGGPDYFKNLVKQSDLSSPLKSQGLAGYVGDAIFNARRLVSFAITTGTNPKDGNATLGTILLPLVQPGQVGLEHATLFAGLIVRYELAKQKAVRDELKARYRIPQHPLADGEPAGGEVSGTGVSVSADEAEILVGIFGQFGVIYTNYFKDLIVKSDWPPEIKDQVRAGVHGSVNAVARHLVNVLLMAGRYGANHHLHGDTLLGRLMLDELEGLGDPDGATFATIIIRNKLVSGEEALGKAKARLGGELNAAGNEPRARYQIPKHPLADGELASGKSNDAAVPPPARTLDDDIRHIIAILVRQALVTSGYFKWLVDKSDWSDALKGKVQGALSGDPNKDAQALINILRAANLYGANHPTRRGDTFLGWVLLGELDGLGDPDGATLAKIVIDRGLVQQTEGLAIAKARLGGGD